MNAYQDRLVSIESLDSIHDGLIVKVEVNNDNVMSFCFIENPLFAIKDFLIGRRMSENLGKGVIKEHEYIIDYIERLIEGFA